MTFIESPYQHTRIYWSIDGAYIPDMDVLSEIIALSLANEPIDYEYFILAAMMRELKGLSETEFLELKPLYESGEIRSWEGLAPMSVKLMGARQGYCYFKKDDNLPRGVEEWFLKRRDKLSSGIYLEVWRFIAESRHTPAMVLEELSLSAHEKIVDVMLSNPNLPARAWKNLLLSETERTRRKTLSSWQGILPHAYAKEVLEKSLKMHGVQKRQMLKILAGKVLELETQFLLAESGVGA